MTALETRSWASWEIREDADTHERVITGLAVPWETATDVGGYREQFARGSVAEQAGGAILYSQHDHVSGGLPIGRIEAVRDEDDGLHIEARISKTAKGDEVYTLLRDGVLRSLSVGFTPIEDEVRDGVVTRTQVLLREVSVVARPAYVGAEITAVRSADESGAPPSASQDAPPAPDTDPAPAVETAEPDAAPVTEAPANVTPADAAEVAPAAGDTTTAETTSADTEESAPMADENTEIVEVRSAIEDLTRRFDKIEGAAPTGDAGEKLEFRSLGEFVKSLTERGRDHKADADMVTRAYTGAVLDDASPRNAFIAKDIKLVEDNRPILGLFDHQPLPATGKTIEFPKFSSKSGDVAEQAAEGDDLTYLELVVTDGTAPVKTYGGYSSLSRQSIERSDIPYLNKVLRMQAISYAKATNSAVRTTLTGLTGTNTGTVLFADKGKADKWVDAALMGLFDIESNSAGLTGDVWIMNLTQFRQLAAIVDGAGRPLFVVNGDGVNSYGDVNIRGVRANVAGLPVFVDPKIAANHGSSYIVSREALTVREDGPFRLDDENVVNLTKDFSLYGYLALETNDAKGVTKVSHPTS